MADDAKPVELTAAEEGIAVVGESGVKSKPWLTEELFKKYVVTQEGVATVVTRRTAHSWLQLGSTLGFFRSWREWNGNVLEFMGRVFKLSPWRVVGQALYAVLSSAIPMVKLYFSTRLSELAYKALESGKVDPRRVLIAFAGSILTTLVADGARVFFRRNEDVIKSLTSIMVKEQLMAARMRLDVGSMSRNTVSEAFRRVDQMARDSGGWGGLISDALSLFTGGASVALQATVLARLAKEPRNRIYVALSLLGVVGYESTYLFRTQRSRRAQVTNTDWRALESAFSDAGEESNRKDLKVLGLGRFFYERFRRHSDQLGKISTSCRTWHEPWLSNAFDITADSALYALFAFQAASSTAVSISLADLQFIRGSAHSLLARITDIVHALSSFQGHINDIRAFYDILRVAPNVTEPDVPKPYITNFKGMEIEFRDVTFDYPSQKGVLKNVSFYVPPGKVVAIVGGNGSGKSSLVGLLARLYDAKSGEILVNGVNVKEYATEELHSHMSILWQSTEQLQLSIKEFIGVGAPSRMDDQEAIEEAAKTVGVHEKILSKKNGYESQLGYDYWDTSTPEAFVERCLKSDWKQANEENETRTALQREADEVKAAIANGENAAAALEEDDQESTYASFSGGEWRRIACARALFRDADLRIWDEFSSGLDSIAERKVFREIWKYRGNATTFFVTHRYSSVSFVDLILCMKEGELVEQGTHDELMERKGHYYSLYQASQSLDEPYVDKEEGPDAEKDAWEGSDDAE